jgi:hypothetical protein
MGPCKAIYFSDTFNPHNPTYGATCITYSPNGEIALFDSNKRITIVSPTDQTQNDSIKVLKEEINTLYTQVDEMYSVYQTEIAELKETISILKTENAGGVLDTGTCITVTSVVGDVGSTDKPIVIYPTTVTTSPGMIQGKSVQITGLSSETTDNKIAYRIVAKSDVVVTDLTIGGAWLPSNTNIVDIQSAENIKIDQSVISASGYNGIMIGQPGTVADPVYPKTIDIIGIDFSNGNLTNNTINIYATQDDAVINISGCTFGQCSNPLRLGNTTNASGIVMNIIDCHFPTWDQDDQWRGVLIMEDFTTIETVPAIVGASPSADNSKAWQEWFKMYGNDVIAEENKVNRFGENKIKIAFKNCTYGPEELPMDWSTDEYSKIFGTMDENQIAFIYRYSGSTWYNGTITKRKMLPYAEVDYLSGYNGGSEYYPTITFE